MSQVFLMVGAPGAGKSTLVHELTTGHWHGASRVISPVQVEMKFPQWRGKHGVIFRYLHGQLAELLAEQWVVLVDALNAHPEHRRPFISVAQRHGVPATAIWMDTPLRLCLERAFNRPLNSRQESLTPEIVERTHHMIHHFPPTCDEGFDQVIRVTPDEPFPYDQF